MGDELHSTPDVVCLPDGRYYPRRGGKYAIRRLGGGTAERISFATRAEALAYLTETSVRGAAAMCEAIAVEREPGSYRFTQDADLEAMWEPAQPNLSRWVPVRVQMRTIVLTAEGHWHAVYLIEDRRGTSWIAGEGELREGSGGDA